jgi:predicted ATPase/DNA-binding CsgD family transcriptional regulator
VSLSESPDCVVCGRAVRRQSAARSSASRYCSNACRQRAYRRRLRSAGLTGASSTGAGTQLNSFVGRVDELIEVTRLMRDARLVTLTGPAGTGKTRLAVEMGAREQRGGRYDVVFVALAPVTDGRLVRQRIETVLREETDWGLSPAQAASDYRCLLILDNCEHVLEDCGRALAEVLLRQPRLRVLATSREALRVPGEVVYSIRGLLPLASGERGTLVNIARLPAVSLFTDRARAIKPDFRLTEQNAAQIAEVCIRLDGLPLAIELAAGLVRAFPLAEILHRLSDRLNLLIGGWRNADTRHHSLRAALDWSYRLLTGQESALFRSLSVLPGDFGTDLAASVVADHGIVPAAVPRLLVALEAKSLIESRPDQAGTARFRMLESVRFYGREQLAARNEAADTHDLIIDHFVEVTGAFPDTGILTPAAVARLHAEEESLQSALRLLGEGADGRRLVLAAGVDVLAMLQGHAPDDCGRLSRALSCVDPASEHRPAALATEAALALWRGDPGGALRLAAESSMLAPRPDGGRMQGLVELVDHLSSARSTAPELHACLEASMSRQDTVMVALCLYAVARRFLFWGDAESGQYSRLVGEALAVSPGDMMPGPFRELLQAAGALALEGGNLQQSEEHFSQLLRASLEPRHVALALEGLAVTAVATRRYERGLELLAAAEEMGHSPEVTAASWWRSRIRAAEATARNTLPSARAGAAIARGRALLPPEAASYALTSDAPSPAGTVISNRLSGREREVAALVAQGLTNRQIAARLYVSVRTVETHVRHVREALGLQTRAHVAAWVAQHGKAVI